MGRQGEGHSDVSPLTAGTGSEEDEERELLFTPQGADRRHSRFATLFLSFLAFAACVFASWVAGGFSSPRPAAMSSIESGFAVRPGKTAPIAPPLPLQGPCRDKESCLRVIDTFLDAQPRAFDLLQVRSPKNLYAGECGELCNIPGPCPEGDAKCRYDTYDSALAAIYYTKRGHLEKAKPILDAFIKTLYPVGLESFHPKSQKTQYIGVATGKIVTLLASSYNKAVEPMPGNYEAPGVTDGGVDTGNNAWAALAFAHYAAAVSSSCYLAVARDILGAIVDAGDCSTDVMGGYMGHLEPYTGMYRSGEHNIDLFGLAKVLGDQEVMEHTGTFVGALFDANRGFNGTYATGTAGDRRCDHNVAPGYPIAADATFWNILADADPNLSHLQSALRFALRTPGAGRKGHLDPWGLWVSDVDRVYRGEPHKPTLYGIRFSTQGHGVQWENTASAVMAMVHFSDKYGAIAYPQLQTYIDAARDSLKLLLNMYEGIPSSVLGGNYAAWQAFTRGESVDPNYAGGTDTGLGWPYLRYLAVAPTAWTGLMLLLQAEGSEAINEDANPYGVPAKPLPPDDHDRACLPPGALKKRVA